MTIRLLPLTLIIPAFLLGGCTNTPTGAPSPAPIMTLVEPTASPSPAPTATPLPLRVELEQRWAKGDWSGVDALLAAAKNGPEWSDDLTPKRYAAAVNKATEEMNAGRYPSATFWFNSALKIDPNGGEAKLGLQQIPQKQRDDLIRQARANAKLEVTSWSCTRGSYGYNYLEGEVKNISGQSLKNIMAVGSWYTDSNQFITSDDALLDYNPVLPNQTSPFKVMTRANPAMTGCKLEFKELFGGTVASYDPNK